MNNNIFHLFVILGAVFGFLAALISYLITYKEQIHYLSTKKEKRKKASEVAIFTFIFFFVLMLVIGYFI